MKQQIKKFVTCPKCKGTGYFEHYAHVWYGNCFLCSGTGVLTTRLYQKYLDAKTFLSNVLNTITNCDRDLQFFNSKIEERISMGFSVHPNTWKHVSEIEILIDRYRKEWLRSSRLVTDFNNRFEFVN